MVFVALHIQHVGSSPSQFAKAERIYLGILFYGGIFFYLRHLGYLGIHHYMGRLYVGRFCTERHL